MTDENMFADLRRHIGHKTKCVCYGDKSDPANVAIECVTCDEIIIDADNPGGDADITDIGIPEGDYTLIDGAAWFAVGNNLSIRVKATDGGVAVDIYKRGEEDGERIAGTWADG